MEKLQNDPHRTVFRCSLFLHIGYIGAVAAAAGLIQLSAGEASWPSTLALIFFGGILATASWWRARSVVQLSDRAPAVTTHLRRPAVAKQPQGSPKMTRLPVRRRFSTGQESC